MKKQIQITMPDGSIWGVPAEVVAENRAEYYADKDSSDKPDTFEKIKHREYAYTLEDNGTIIDWAENNMNWVHVARYATLIRGGSVDYQEGWVNGPKRVVESANAKLCEEGGK